MVQPAEVGFGNDVASFWWLRNSRLRRVSVERQMRPCIMVVGEVFGQDATKMGLVEDDHVVQTFAANRADQVFAIWILPRRAWRSQHLFDAHVRDSTRELVAVDSVAIAKQEPRRLIERERLDDLLGGQ